MSKQTSRKFMCLCISAVAAYTACFLLLWDKALTVRTNSLSDLSKPLLYHSVTSKEFTEGRFDVKLEEIIPVQLLSNNVTRDHRTRRVDSNRTDSRSRYYQSALNRNIYSSSVKPTKNSFETLKRIYAGSKKFFLTEVIMVRIYRNDLAKWTIRELKQWMHYMFYAGVEHVYLCDHFIYHHERLKSSLSKYVEKGFLTYIEWPWNASSNGGNIMRHQVNCYSHVIRKYGMDSEWQMSIDMDEYPVCLKDKERQFLPRFLIQQPGRVSQILMPNFLMLGQGNRSKTMTIERITRITKKIANALTKPIYRTSAIRRPDIHRHYIKSGSTIIANSAELRMLHYWGARLQNWGPDTKKTIEITDKYDFVRDHIASAIRSDLTEFGENDAFSNVTGP